MIEKQLSYRIRFILSIIDLKKQYENLQVDQFYSSKYIYYTQTDLNLFLNQSINFTFFLNQSQDKSELFFQKNLL